MLLYLVRHGQSEGNIATYDVPDARLTDIGHGQAADLGRRFEGEQIDLVIASPMRRAVQTALHIKRQTGAPLEIWQHSSEVRRLALSPLLGRSGLVELAPDAILPDDYPEAAWDYGMQTTEGTNERARGITAQFLTRFAHTDKQIVMVSHGGFINYLLMALIGTDFDHLFAVAQRNCCINKIVITPDRVRLHSLNDVRHLCTVT